MEILRTISLYAESTGIKFLVIGGQALNALGLSRQTGDIDLIVSLEEREKWLELFKKLDFTPHQDDKNFSRFKPKELTGWPLDLMYVDTDTFNKLYEDSIKQKLDVADVRIVSPRHLATLKIHALKHYQEHRAAKDYNDLLWLLKTKKTDLTIAELKELCLRYADKELFDRLVSDLEKTTNGR